MLRFILALALVSSIFADRVEVLVFRGLIPMMTCQFDTAATTISGEIGVSLSDCKNSPESQEFQDSIQNLTYKEDSSTKTIIPYRFLEKVTLKTTHYLGAVIQTTFRCSKTGDEFQVSLVFGYCRNDLKIGDFKRISENIEEARVNQNAKIQDTRKIVKNEGGKTIANQNTLDELHDAKLQAEKRREELNKENEKLNADIKKREDKLVADESETAKLEEGCENCEAEVKMKRGQICTLEINIESIERQITELDKRLQVQVETDFTEEYNSAIEKLNLSISGSKIYNQKMTIPAARKGTQYNHKDLECLF